MANVKRACIKGIHTVWQFHERKWLILTDFGLLMLSIRFFIAILRPGNFWFDALLGWLITNGFEPFLILLILILESLALL